MNVYLDYAASAPLSKTTKDYLVALLDTFCNPNALRFPGEQADKILSDARRSVGKLLHADAETIYFTSGAAASTALAIHGYLAKHNCYILYTPTAQAPVLGYVRNYKRRYPVPVDCNGLILFKHLQRLLAKACFPPFVIMDYANLEIGTVQNVKEIISLVHSYNGVVLLDCTASISSVPVDVKALNVDMLVFCADKLGALAGCGVLYKKADIELKSLLYNSQETGLVGEAPNLLGIAALGKVCESYDYALVSSKSRDYVYQYIVNNIPGSFAVGSLRRRLPNNLYLCFQGIAGEALALLLDMQHIQVASGSSCGGGRLLGSPTLSAIGMDQNDMQSCIRMTFSSRETQQELDYVCSTLKKCVSALRNKKETPLCGRKGGNVKNPHQTAFSHK